jgi:pectinesterase
MNISVNPNGSVDFKTITEAIDNIPAPNTRRVVVFIAPGLYRYQNVINFYVFIFLFKLQKSDTLIIFPKCH